MICFIDCGKKSHDSIIDDFVATTDGVTEISDVSNIVTELHT